MKILKWLSVTDRFAKMYLDNQLAPLGINSSQHMYLLKICNHPGILQDSLIESFYVHPSNIVRMVSALEKRGFLTRTPYAKDKRTCQLYPTQKALSIVGHIQTACKKTEAILMDRLSTEEQEIFDSALFYMGKTISKELHVERVEDEFDEREPTGLRERF
jgi:DNA-binding MarR family transcriptional regulator